MKRIVLMFVRNLFSLPFFLYSLIKYSNTQKHDKYEGYAWLHKKIPMINKRGRVKIECHGIENLPKETGYIMFPNHQGLYDVLSFIETHKLPFSTLSKKEVEHVFLLDRIFRILRTEFIDREDIRQSMTIINNVAKRVKEGDNFIIFAEGTRSKNKNNLLEFKGGSFKSATYAKCPIVPVALIDSYKAFDSGSIKKVTVQIHYLKPLYYEDYKGMKTTEIAELVSSRIQETIKANERD